VWGGVLYSNIRATAFICFDELKMWRQAGFEVVFLQNEIKRDGGTPKTRGFDVHHVYEHSHLLSNVIGST